MFGGIGPTELIIVLFIILIIFGAGKLPEIGGALGKGIKNFKKASNESDAIDITPPEQEIPEDASNENASDEKPKG